MEIIFDLGSRGIFTKSKPSPALTPYYSYTAFAMQEICSTSHDQV